MWEQFKRTKKTSPKDPTITLGSGGAIGLNTAVCKNIIGENKFALLFFDADKMLMGIKFIKASDPDGYPVKLTATRTHGQISGTAFMKQHKIMPATSVNISATYDAKTNMLTANVSEVLGDNKDGKKHK
jgi:hypothetical protein